MNILNTFSKTSKNTFGRRQNYKCEGTEIAFAKTWDLSEVTCYHCEEKGHYARICPKKKTKKGQVHTQMVELDMEDEEGDWLGWFLGRSRSQHHTEYSISR